MRRYICKFLIYFKRQIDYILCNLEVSYFLNTKNIEIFLFKFFFYYILKNLIEMMTITTRILNYTNYSNKKKYFLAKKQVHMFHFNDYNTKFL